MVEEQAQKRQEGIRLEQRVGNIGPEIGKRAAFDHLEHPGRTRGALAGEIGARPDRERQQAAFKSQDAFPALVETFDDPFFEQPGEFIVIKEWDKSDGTGNTSAYIYTIGAHTDALDHLKNGYPGSIAEVRNEQEFITGFLARQGKLSYWPEAWCRSFKRHCLRRGLMGWFAPPTIPSGARIIAFHGKPNPPDAIAGVSGKWYRRVMPTQWVADHWR